MAARIIAFPASSAPRAPSTAGFWAAMAAMLEARRTRLALAALDRHELADIGISRGDAMIEAGRPFWDLAPRHRR